MIRHLRIILAILGLLTLLMRIAMAQGPLDVEITERRLAEGGGMEISWTSEEGRSYNVERSFDLVEWGDLYEVEGLELSSPPLREHLSWGPTPLDPSP